MTIRQLRWMATLGLVLGLPAISAAEEVVWRAVRHDAAPAAPVAAPVDVAPPPAWSGPVATLGRPVAIVPSAPATAVEPVGYRVPAQGPVVRGQAPESLFPPPPPPPGALVSLTSEAAAPPRPPIPYPAPAPAPVAPFPDPAPPPPASTVVPHVVGGPPDNLPPPGAAPFPDPSPNPSVALDRPIGTSWWDKATGWCTWGDKSDCSHRAKFQSDHAFDFLASPVTNPFFFEDPRALTEVRPIFTYQSAPSGNPIFRGGHSEFFGTQARVAFTERLSLVVNEFGFVSLHPNSPTPDVQQNTGFGEIKLGPKYTFLRNTATGTVAAAGLTFELPAGSHAVSQDTGSLGFDPYVTFGQHFRLPSGFGSLNLLGAMGYSFSADNKRSEFFHTSWHLDYNVANTNFYPLIELNYFHYTNGGKARDLGMEGADLVNFGSTNVGERNLLNMAFGLRYKFSENVQIGGAFEWPILNHHDTLSDVRFTFDVIFRY